MKKIKKKQTVDPTDFPTVEAQFSKRVAALGDLDDDAANLAYSNLACPLLRYASTITKRDAVHELGAYVARRDRSAAPFKMDVYQLAVELVMPGKYPPLGSSLRRKLALELAFATLRGVEPGDLPAFLKKLPPVRTMKVKLGLVTMVPGSAGWAKSATTRLKRVLRTKRPPHRLAGSPSDKLRKQGAKAWKRSQLSNTDD